MTAEESSSASNEEEHNTEESSSASNEKKHNADESSAEDMTEGDFKKYCKLQRKIDRAMRRRAKLDEKIKKLEEKKGTVIVNCNLFFLKIG
jgi:RNA processing factor Prp31